MRGVDFENNDFFKVENPEKSGYEHMRYLLDSLFRNKKDTSVVTNLLIISYYLDRFWSAVSETVFRSWTIHFYHNEK